MSEIFTTGFPALHIPRILSSQAPADIPKVFDGGGGFLGFWNGEQKKKKV